MNEFEKELISKVYGDDMIELLEDATEKVHELGEILQQLIEDYQNESTPEKRKYLDDMIMEYEKALNSMMESFKEIRERLGFPRI